MLANGPGKWMFLSRASSTAKLPVGESISEVLRHFFSIEWNVIGVQPLQLPTDWRVRPKYVFFHQPTD